MPIPDGKDSTSPVTPPAPAFPPPEEVGKIDYLLDQLGVLQERGLVSMEAVETANREYTHQARESGEATALIAACEALLR